MPLGFDNPLTAVTDFFSDPFKRKSQYGEVDPNNDLTAQARAAGFFANRSQDGYASLGNEGNALRQQIAGRPSVSAEQLRQGLQQQQGQMMSAAASARPGAAPMAARTAMLGAGRAGSAMSGQAAIARMQEQQMKDQTLAQMIAQQRQQDLQAALGARGQSIQGQGMLEQARTQRYGIDMGTPTGQETLLNNLGSMARASQGG